MSGKVAIVAGASQGIGAVTAEAFARAGAAVVVAARREQKLADVVERIRAAGGEALAVPTDVGDAASMENLVRRTVREYGRLDAAFNNATDGPRPAPLADIDVEDFDRGIRTNIRGTFLGMKYQITAMLRTGGGAIVNMASVAGARGTSLLSTYTAAKAGIIGLTKAAALEYADHGIRINVVAPGPILTDGLAGAPEEARQRAAESTPMRRIGQAGEVADAVLWLCSDQSAFITGVMLPIDGGQLAGHKLERAFNPNRRTDHQEES